MSVMAAASHQSAWSLRGSKRDPGCSSHLAIAVLSEPSSENRVARVFAARKDRGHSSPHWDARLRRRIAWKIT